MEANLTPSDGTSGVGPAQVQILSFGKEVWHVNGVCPSSTRGQNSVAAGRRVYGNAQLSSGIKSGQRLRRWAPLKQ